MVKNKFLKGITLLVCLILTSLQASAGLVTCPTDPAGAVYTEIRQKDSLVLVQVGTIAPNIPCDATQGVVKDSGVYFVVPSSSVNWLGPTHPDVVFAVCAQTPTTAASRTSPQTKG